MTAADRLNIGYGYSADSCGRGDYLESNRKSVLNARECRVRAGWRLLVFLVILFVVAAVDGRVVAGLAGRPTC